MRVRRLLSVASAAVAVAACAQIVGFEDLDLAQDDAGPDAMAGADAVSGTEAASEASADAPAETGADAQPAATFCATARDAGIDGAAVIFCDDFERTTPIGVGWNLAVTFEHESLELTTSRAASGARSLYAALPKGENDAGRSAYLQANLSVAALPVVLEFDLYVEKTQEYGPGGELSGFLFAYFGAGSAQLPLAAGAIGDAGWNPYLTANPGPIVVLSLGGWHHVSYRMDDTGLSASFTAPLGATTTRSHGMKLDPPNVFWVGLNVGTGGGPAKIYVDNVVVLQ